MAEAFLVPSWISTVGDTRNQCFVVDRCVPQGSPLSPSLYNLFVDEFAERVSGTHSDAAYVPALLFADDVLITAKSPTGPQALLGIASNWAIDRQMTWNTEKGKSGVLLSRE